jgi:glycosyltransferase involved in cell wall biosynthesis
MRLGICVRTWGEIGGIGVYTRSLVHEIVALGRDHEYVLFYQDRSHLGNFPEHRNVREVYVPTTGKLKAARTWIWDQMTLPFYARRENVDVIFHTKFAIPLPTRRKTTMVLHGTQRFVHPELHEKGDMWFFRTIYPYYLRRASLILAVSECSRRDVIQHLEIDPDKVRTVYLAANPAFRVIDDDGLLERVRKKYGLPRRFVVYVGHICPGKNVDRLFKAIARVREEEDIDLVMAGGLRWGYQQDLALLPKLGLEEHVHLVGHVPHEDLIAFYNLAELMAFPSFYESFGIPILEANASGCPVVTCPTGGVPESAGDAAAFVQPTDEAGLANTIIRILNEPELRKDLIEKGFENVKRFSWKQTARQTLDALESLVG